MLYGNREEMRQFFVATFHKRRSATVLTPLETLVADIIEAHPEYHDLLEKNRVQDEYNVESGLTNPFLHMAMHIAIREQVQTDRPPGIRVAWQRLVARQGDVHDAEHLMLDCLGDAIASAQREGRPPDEHTYLEAVRRL